MAAFRPITTEPGHSLPPESPHTISVHLPRWENALRIRDGDATIFATIKSFYPRFFPFGPAGQLAAVLGEKLGATPGKDGVVMFMDPAAFAAHKAYCTSHHRKEHKLADGDLTFRVVDIHGVRLYCILFPLAKRPGVMGVWQNTGIGASTRLAEELLRYVDSDFAIVEWSAGDMDTADMDVDVDVNVVPPPTYLPECEAHGALRRRIRDLLHRAPLDADKVKVAEEDVFLYQTGMAAIYRLHEVLVQRDPATLLVLGSIFHNTFHLFEESPGGMKHVGACDAPSSGMDTVEAYLEAHYKEGKTVSYAFLEFPSNPILVSADLRRLRKIADKYSFPIVIDDTIGSFANIDVLPVADFVISSLTKSFSGYADVIAGSVVLNPLSTFYPEVKPVFTSSFHNELFTGDAEKLLANSEDYLARTVILNRNAATLATYFANHAATTTTTSSSNPNSPIKAVLYPTTNQDTAYYDAFKRGPTPDFPTTGYGCLLSVDFKTLDAAKAFTTAAPSTAGRTWARIGP